MVTTITREQVMEIYEYIVREVPELTDKERNALREVALTAERIAGDGQWWDVDAECGCLVGTWLHRSPRGGPLQNAGVVYVFAMDRVLLGSRTAPVLAVTQ